MSCKCGRSISEFIYIQLQPRRATRKEVHFGMPKIDSVGSPSRRQGPLRLICNRGTTLCTLGHPDYKIDSPSCGATGLLGRSSNLWSVLALFQSLICIFNVAYTLEQHLSARATCVWSSGVAVHIPCLEHGHVCHYGTRLNIGATWGTVFYNDACVTVILVVLSRDESGISQNREYIIRVDTDGNASTPFRAKQVYSYLKPVTVLMTSNFLGAWRRLLWSAIRIGCKKRECLLPGVWQVFRHEIG